MEGQIRLRWTSHQGTLLSVFDALLSSEAFVDVTLASEGKYLRAHKVVLSACSPYFQELLSIDMNKHPILFLKDVKYSELKALIQYMYRGEVNIAHDELESLLSVAQDLKIRGLAEVETTNNSISSDTIILPDVGGNKHNKGLSSHKSTPNSLPIIPPPIIQTSNPSHNTNRHSSLNSIPSTTPPPPKKSRTDNTRISSQIQRQSQMIDPLLNADTQPTPTVMAMGSLTSRVSSSSMYDPSPSASHYKSHPLMTVKDYGHEGMVEEPEPMYTQGDMKMEEMIDNIEVDLDEDNSMSRSSFSDGWKMDGDNSGIGDDDEDNGDGEVPSYSGSVKNNDGVGVIKGGGGGGDGSEVGRNIGIGKKSLKNSNNRKWFCNVCSRSYTCLGSLNRHIKYECENAIPSFFCGFCNSAFKHKFDLMKHIKNRSCVKRALHGSFCSTSSTTPTGGGVDDIVSSGIRNNRNRMD